VVGTDLATTVGSDGRFQFVDVPSGSVRLQFTGTGVDVTTTISNVTSDQFIEIQVQISNTSAVVVADSREGKVTMCHVEGNGSYHSISVSTSAEPTHRAHGDGKIGEPVPGQTALTFDENCQPAGPSVAIEVFTNGHNANTPTGPSIVVGSPVAWTYLVTNSGTANLTNLVVADSRGVAVNCHGVASLAPNASVQCDASGSAVLGQYSNVGSVTASWTLGGSSGTATDSDPSHYLGIPASAGGAAATVTLCHKLGNGRYSLLTVDQDAEPAHRQHGDAKVGEAVPGVAGKIFGPACSVQ
jgi:hypothetical protein